MRINEKDLDLLINKIKSNNISSLEYQDDDFRISLSNETSKIINEDTFLLKNNFEYQTKLETEEKEVEKETKSNKEFTDIYSPLIGNFYLTKEPNAPQFVNVGDKVSKGDVICVIEAMKMISEVKSEVNGIIREISIEPGEFVDLDTIIFKIEEE